MAVKVGEVYNILLFDEPAYVTKIDHTINGSPYPALDFVPVSTHSDDMPVKSKYKVFFPADGTILWRDWSENGGGHSIRYKKDNGVILTYCHFENTLKKRFKKGDRVKKNQYIGIMGSSGHSTNKHVHVMGKKDGKHISNEDLITELGGKIRYQWLTYTLIGIGSIILISIIIMIIRKRKSSRKRIRGRR